MVKWKILKFIQTCLNNNNNNLVEPLLLLLLLRWRQRPATSFSSKFRNADRFIDGGHIHSLIFIFNFDDRRRGRTKFNFGRCLSLCNQFYDWIDNQNGWEHHVCVCDDDDGISTFNDELEFVLPEKWQILTIKLHRCCCRGRIHWRSALQSFLCVQVVFHIGRKTLPPGMNWDVFCLKTWSVRVRDAAAAAATAHVVLFVVGVGIAHDDLLALVCVCLSVCLCASIWCVYFVAHERISHIRVLFCQSHHNEDVMLWSCHHMFHLKFICPKRINYA